MKFEIHKFKSVTSTNDVAINLIKKKRTLFGCVYADIQTRGRGTNGKSWISKKGNLFTSLFFPLEKQHPTFSQFSIINPVLISNVIKRITKTNKINLKFPNDIFLNEKKICGILQEVVNLKGVNFLIIGIGLNIKSNPIIDNTYKATNIFFETKNEPKIKEVIKLIILSYENFFLKLNSFSYKNFKKKAEAMSIK
tara:strand:- start:98 stop:682 length:585 start_codon:yes stop_codon:yes gene_type:complete